MSYLQLLLLKGMKEQAKECAEDKYLSFIQAEINFLNKTKIT